MLPKASLGRDRNAVKFTSWGVYIHGDITQAQMTVQCLRAAASTQKARVFGGRPNQSLVFTRVTKNKVEVAWPLPVSVDTCTRLLKQALGEKWRRFVTDPAGVQGADQEAATAVQKAGTSKQRAVAAEAAREDRLEDAQGATVSGDACLTTEASGSRGASGLAARHFSSQPSSSEATVAASAATDEARDVNLLAMKMEAITRLYVCREEQRSRFHELQHLYTVTWGAELGKGAYGKVYLGHKGPATGIQGQHGVAIKMLRDEGPDRHDAAWTADMEVRRHVSLGLHPNVVGLVDVALFWQPRQDGQEPRGGRAHIGLVFGLYEIDARQFTKTSLFTPGGMRHVLNSVLEGLRFIHDAGCIHCDLKPANVFMRGATHLRGCFERKLQQRVDCDAVAPCPHSKTEFEYQIPTSFEVREGKGAEGTEGWTGRIACGGRRAGREMGEREGRRKGEAAVG